jgi:hypothetical protein
VSARRLPRPRQAATPEPFQDPHEPVQIFIDRPIFAGVLSVLIFLAGLIAMRAADLGIPRGGAALGGGARPVPGANPKVIAETVATPLEEPSTASKACSTWAARPPPTA